MLNIEHDYANYVSKITNIRKDYDPKNIRV